MNTKDSSGLFRLDQFLGGALAAAVLVLMPAGVRANDEVPHEARGYSQSGYALSTYEHINLANGNLVFRIPLYRLRTDGGLEYELALHHNSKVWLTHRYCSLSPSGYADCQGAGGTILEAEIAHGVEEFGFGWEMRPPRIVLHQSEPFPRMMAYLDASGAKHKLSATPPWEMGDDPFSGAGSESTVGDRFYTRDGSNMRFTVLSVDGSGRPARFEMENGVGDVYVFGQVVPTACDVDRGLSPDDDDFDDFNFRMETSGLYLSEIQRGPWRTEGGVQTPANSITFAYRGESPGWDAECGGAGHEPWLVNRMTASGEVEREIEIQYAPVTSGVARIVVPAFSPVFGDHGTPQESEEITITIEERLFDQTNGPSAFSFSAAHLERIVFPNGASFEFDQELPPRLPPLSDVVLPSGAQVRYGLGWYPVGRGRCEDGFEGEGDCLNWTTCGTSVPRLGEGLSTELMSQGVSWREIYYHDAVTHPGGPRLETTWFSQGLNCAVNRNFTMPPNEVFPWPYDFYWALHDDSGLFHPEYLWTVVYSTGGSVGPGSTGVVKIHRFHPVTREEFSVDELAGDSIALSELPLIATMGVEDLSGSDLRVLRHMEIERELKFGPNYPSVTDGSDRYTFVRQRRTYADEASSDPQTADVEFCYPPVEVPASGPPTVAIDCAETRETFDTDDYLNRVWRSVESFRSESGLEVNRRWHGDYLLDDVEDHWYLRREGATEVCENGMCTNQVRDWSDHSEPGARSWFAPVREVVNPGQGGGCYSDCVERVFGYDAVGNRREVTVAGGYGSGFGLLETRTRVDHRHGRPVKKTTSGDGVSLVLWERDVDPGTGLIRWHLSGSGVGFAYGYDGVGGLAEIAPVKGSRIGSQWTLQPQRTSDGSRVYGSRVDRIFPTGSELLRHEVREALFVLTPGGGGDRLELDWLAANPVNSFFFDGLGRTTRVEEAYPSGSGTRARLELDILWDGSVPCATGGGTDLDHETRITLASEWRDAADTALCSDFDWTVTRFDPLNRPAILQLPDGSETFVSHRGDHRQTTLRAVGTATGGHSDWFSTTRLSDGLGRIRWLEEEVAPGEFYWARYDHDRHDRLMRARSWESEPFASPLQERLFTYSTAGFLLSSIEPERTVAFHGYDGLGNLKSSTTGGVTTNHQHDGVGRLLSRRVAGLPAATWIWGDSQSGGGARVGDPAYGKVVKAVQHNRFGASDVMVTIRRQFGDPGSNVTNRILEIDGVGDPDDRFEIEYGYDRRGQRSSVVHPLWTGWDDSCQTPVEHQEERANEWLTGTAARIGDSPWSVAESRRDYHANGRVSAEEFLAAGAPVGTLFELVDPAGMARPAGFEMRRPDGSLLWTEGPYEFDGSGNVVEIGNRHYAYDGLDRLVEMSDNGELIERYSHDRWGNLYRLENTETAAGGGQNLRLWDDDFDNRPELLFLVGIGNGALQWDSRGNLRAIPAVGHIRAKTFEYSGEDRLKEATDPDSATIWRFAYDTEGERVLSWRRMQGGGVEEVRLTLRDEGGSPLSDWLLIPEVDFAPTRDYIRTGSRLGLQLDWVGDNVVARYPFHDHLGSTRALVTANGTLADQMEFYPYGGLRSGGPVPGTSHLFTGHERDLGHTASQLDFMHARHYSPILGRFTSVDSVSGTPGDSQSWNRYTYTTGNPLRAVDPDGRYEEDVHNNLTQYLALAAGWKASDAKQIAKANQSVDGKTWANPLAPQNFALHFGPRDQAVAKARKAEGTEALGKALHSVQDSFSHEGFGWPLGHGPENLKGESPDDPWRDVPKAMEMAELTFELLGGNPEDLDRVFLEILFETRSKEDRKDMLDNASGGDASGIPNIVGITPADPGHWQKIVDYYEGLGYRVVIH